MKFHIVVVRFVERNSLARTVHIPVTFSAILDPAHPALLLQLKHVNVDGPGTRFAVVSLSQSTVLMHVRIS